MNIIRIVIIALLLSFSMIFGARLHFGVSANQKFRQVCELIESKHFDPSKVKNIITECYRKSIELRKLNSEEKMVQELERLLQQSEDSHFQIYRPIQVNEIWQGVFKATGIYARLADSEMVIYKILKGSDAEKKGLRAGDVVESIDGEWVGAPKIIWSTEGEYTIFRKSTNQRLKLKIFASELVENRKLKIERYKNSLVVSIPSFLKSEFSEADVKNIIDNFENNKDLKSLVVDLRGNGGGNFYSGISFLSHLVCKKTKIGALIGNKRKQKVISFVESYDSEAQVEQLRDSYMIELYSKELECRHKFESIAVLVDGETASVAEIVALALREFLGAKIFGTQSAGKVLAGVWYSTDFLMKGSKISIPEYIYRSSKDVVIENNGVSVDQTLYYDIELEVNSKDSWLEKVTNEPVSL